MQLPEAWFVPCLRWALSGSLPSWRSGVDGACAKQPFYCPISHLPEGEHVWSCFQAVETTRQAAGPTQLEAAETLLGPMGSRGLDEN